MATMVVAIDFTATIFIDANNKAHVFPNKTLAIQHKDLAVKIRINDALFN
ncbi:MAG: hypothetical protein RBS51_05150 [Anaerovoracaceae bacterium]|jgi:hypothetical protein|nr:hypothetical protein [Anaerovoracaceae bacterium]